MQLLVSERVQERMWNRQPPMVEAFKWGGNKAKLSEYFGLGVAVRYRCPRCLPLWQSYRFHPACWLSSHPCSQSTLWASAASGSGLMPICQTVSKALSVTPATGQHPLPKGEVKSTCAGNNRISLGCFKVKDHVSES